VTSECKALRLLGVFHNRTVGGHMAPRLPPSVLPETSVTSPSAELFADWQCFITGPWGGSLGHPDRQSQDDGHSYIGQGGGGCMVSISALVHSKEGDCKRLEMGSGKGTGNKICREETAWNTASPLSPLRYCTCAVPQISVLMLPLCSLVVRLPGCTL
jgi:hypothetical protein